LKIWGCWGQHDKEEVGGEGGEFVGMKDDKFCLILGRRSKGAGGGETHMTDKRGKRKRRRKKRLREEKILPAFGRTKSKLKRSQQQNKG